MSAIDRLQAENEDLRRRLGEAEDALRAIHEGQVDAIVVEGEQGTQIFSLAGAERIYRVLVETMNEAALAVAPDGTILFCNRRFCDLMRSAPAETLGLKLDAFTPAEERAEVAALLAAARTGTAQRQFVLLAADGTAVPVHLAATPLDSGENASVCVVASDLTDLEASARAIQILQEHERAMEEALAAQRSSEERYRRLVETSSEGIWLVDANLKIIDANVRMAEMLGCAKDEIVGRHANEFLPPEEAARSAERMDRRLRGQPETYEIPLRRKDGSTCWTLISASPLGDDQGTIIGAFGMFTDITKRKQAQEELRESEQRLRLMIETSPVAIGFGDSNGRILSANESFYRLTGYTREELQASQVGWDRLTAPEYTELDRHIMATLAATGSAGPYEKEYIRKDGSRVPLLLSVSKLPGRDEHVAFIVDITARKQAEENARRGEAERKVAEVVRAERERLHGVLETLPAMICLLTPDYHLAFANRAFRKAFGMANGRRCYEYCFGKSAPCDFCQTYDVLRTGQPHQWEVTTPSGMVIDVHDFPFTDADGSRMILEMDLDITEWRRAEKELQGANESLAERASQLRALAGELTLSEQRERRRLARVLHDHLQQLLVAAKFRTAIVGRLGDELAQQAAAEVEHLLDESISAARLLTSELSPPILQESGLPAGLEWLARWMADRHGLLVNLAVEEDLPPLAEEVRVLLFESLRELLFNAVKHAHVTSANVSMRRLADDNVRITVSDSGRGFDPAALKKAGKLGVHGFGLFSIRERLELLGGRLDIESTPGNGSRFMLTAPPGRFPAPALPVAAAAPPPAQGEQAAPAVSPAAGAPIRVLIADDHAVVREGLRRMLDHEPGLQIAGEAADGQEAVDMAVTLHPDVILMDVSMPKLDGVEATRAIHRDHPGIRIIGLSMFEDQEHAQAMRRAGAVDYVMKSGPPRDLALAIYRAVQPPPPPSAREGARRSPRSRLRG